MSVSKSFVFALVCSPRSTSSPADVGLAQRRWQRRFALVGVDGLLRDATRKPGKAPTPEATVQRVVALTCGEPPGEATHWTGRAMVKASGLSLRTVQRIWTAHDLQPHRMRTFKRSNDPDFAAKLEAIVGLYLDPPAHSLVLSVDEKSHQTAGRPTPARRATSATLSRSSARGCDRRRSPRAEHDRRRRRGGRHP